MATPIQSTGSRIAGLDSIRFACAALVILYHIQIVEDSLSGRDVSGFQKILLGIYHCIFNGPSAVIVFFIISGFCIHFPFKGPRKLSLVSFYSRRFVRIAVPALVFCLYFWFVLPHATGLGLIVLWSVICEAAYYLVYPLLHNWNRRTGWPLLIVLSYAAAGIVIATHKNLCSGGAIYQQVGPLLVCVIGLPCWILGCWLAEHYGLFPVLSTGQMWLLRISMYATTVLLELARFHSNSVLAGSCVGLDTFAILACAWLGFEISYASRHPRIRALEWAGTWSYSLYLVHVTIQPTFAALGWSSISERPQTHFLLLIVALVASYGFFLAVERPSHLLAVAVGRMADRRLARATAQMQIS